MTSLGIKGADDVLCTRNSIGIEVGAIEILYLSRSTAIIL